MQQMKQLQREYASVAGRFDDNRKACVVDRPHVSTLPLTSRGTEVEASKEPSTLKTGRSFCD